MLEYVRSGAIPDRRIEHDTSLYRLGANSLGMAAVKKRLEKHCGIHIPDDVATHEAFDSVESVSRLLARLGVR